MNQPARSADKGAMLTRRTIVLGATWVVIALPVLAADGSATGFVTDIYDTYKGKDAKGVPQDNARALRRLYEPSLAALLIEDQKIAAKRNEVGLLDFDPFVDAQDFEIKNFDIAVSDDAPGKATATVKFVNFDKPKVIVLALVKLSDGWRIHDITWQRDDPKQPATLRAIYAHGMFPR